MELPVYRSTLCIVEEHCTEYSDEIMWIVQEAELNNRLIIRYLSPQLQYRTFMVNFIQSVGERQHLRRSTVHLAIYLMDAFMDNHNISDNRLELFGSCCILLASKLEENEPNVPSSKKLNELLKCPCVLSDFAVLELMLLKFFKWQLIIPTTSVFVEFWVLNIVSRIDFASTISDEQYYDRRTRAVELVLEFLDVTLLDIKMTNIRPSLLASACMAAARSLLPVVKIWNDNMIVLTSYSYSDISFLTRELLNWRACLITNTISRKRGLLNATDNEEPDLAYDGDEEDDVVETDDEDVLVIKNKRAKRD
ncbi:cyclin-J [Ochlerotatus camptorhynchus]|uniref:cyclin-J n=1 Tax=Ochlerotatus camptorhynchus TaxID=644619 RepID=UPI0031DB6C6F